MNTYLWVMAILFAAEVVFKLWCLGTGVALPRSLSGMAGDALIGVVILVWTIVLLFKG